MAFSGEGLTADERRQRRQRERILPNLEYVRRNTVRWLIVMSCCVTLRWSRFAELIKTGSVLSNRIKFWNRD